MQESVFKLVMEKLDDVQSVLMAYANKGKVVGHAMSDEIWWKLVRIEALARFVSEKPPKRQKPDPRD